MSRKIQYSAIASINPGDITSSHILDAELVNADISASAAIVYSKLDLTGGIVNADISASAAIAGSKLQALSVGANAGVIPSTGVAAAHVAAAAAIAGSKLQALSVGANAGVIPSTGVAAAHVAAAAAIEYSKLSLTGGIVNADISAGAAIVDTKLAQIATASKVSGAALTALASIPSGAGVIPAANVPGGSYANGQTTRTNAQSTGTQNIAHGLGLTPKYVRITAFWGSANNTSQYCMSLGVGNATTNEQCMLFAYNQGTGAHLMDQADTNIISLRLVAGTGAGAAQLSALDATNITLNWSTAVDATHTCFIQWEAFA